MTPRLSAAVCKLYPLSDDDDDHNSAWIKPFSLDRSCNDDVNIERYNRPFVSVYVCVCGFLTKLGFSALPRCPTDHMVRQANELEL